MIAKLLSSAKIGKTHGLKGYLKLHPFSEEINHLLKLKEVSVVFPNGQKRSLSISDIFKENGQLYVQFSSFDTPEKAKSLTNSIIEINREDVPKLKSGEYYIADLYEMDVFSEDGELLGKIVDTREGGQALLLEILSNIDNKIYLVPLLPVYIKNIDIYKNSCTLTIKELLKSWKLLFSQFSLKW